MDVVYNHMGSTQLLEDRGTQLLLQQKFQRDLYL
jgi:hypothetical protein